MVEWILVGAAILPLVAAVSAKAGGSQFDNHEPRAWLAHQSGWRARAHAAQKNTFEALPLFYAAVLFALYKGVDTDVIVQWGCIWLGLRLAYIWIYIKDWALTRSIVWGLSFIVSIFILFL
ncbi:MAG TPA: MAPEG family protein [Paenalcaligenes hominis]|uniref:MAPEG family protein n=1 Tax=Paenalcaligenes hominis TaxID=643674 RepID=A0A1U9K2C0_9BURK|nr:MAPEG family protein [Paenalcaligenes hominis]AQS52213.1 hypothetical protein PAEH1_12975 [Paenalcaligenes hominis]NJB66052.1 putative MAPEG superfamily protein [Paenalcaligenes hominis]GGE71679.1 hypothetical protein GCM10007278_19880 [Paenalcaligenes hominis]HJH24155.1 MAPEG family protein [Paenalcaligenes hominis]